MILEHRVPKLLTRRSNLILLMLSLAVLPMAAWAGSADDKERNSTDGKAARKDVQSIDDATTKRAGPRQPAKVVVSRLSPILAVARIGDNNVVITHSTLSYDARESDGRTVYASVLETISTAD